MPALLEIDDVHDMRALRPPFGLGSVRPQAAGPAPLVLVVDDDEPVRQSLCELLESAGIAVAGFNSARALLDSDLLSAPGCLIVDVRMPGLGGVALQEHLVARGDTKPIIFLTGGDVQLSLGMLNAGAVLLTKPVRGQALIDTVTAALVTDARRRTQRRLAIAAGRNGEGISR